MQTYKDEKLEKIGGKTGGKNKNPVDGFYKDSHGNEYFIKQPQDKKELFTELFAGLLLTEFMKQGLVDELYHKSLICADLIKLQDGSYGLIQPKVSFEELFKVIETGYSDNSDRNPFKEIFGSENYYKRITKGEYFGLSLALMLSLLLGDYSVHSGNVVCLTSKQPNSETTITQHARIDWGAAFRYYGNPNNNRNIFNPCELQELFGYKKITKGYILYYQDITGLFPSITKKAKEFKELIDEKLKGDLSNLINTALSKIPSDLLDKQTQDELAQYLGLPPFKDIQFGKEETFGPFISEFLVSLKWRLQSMIYLEQSKKEMDPNQPVYESICIHSKNDKRNERVSILNHFSNLEPVTDVKEESIQINDSNQAPNSLFLKAAEEFHKAAANSRQETYERLLNQFNLMSKSLQKKHRAIFKKAKKEYQRYTTYLKLLDEFDKNYSKEAFSKLKEAFEALPESLHKECQKVFNEQKERESCQQLSLSFNQAKTKIEKKDTFDKFSMSFRNLSPKEQRFFKNDYITCELSTRFGDEVSNPKRWAELAEDNPAAHQLLNAMFEDKVLRAALQNIDMNKLSSPLMNDLLTLKYYRDTTAAFRLKHKLAMNSLNEFYETLLHIRLSEENLSSQSNQIIAFAQSKNRHTALRVFADLLMIFSLIGAIIGLIRKAQGHSFFFSFMAPNQESSFAENWMDKQSCLENEDNEEICLFKNPLSV